MAVGKILSGEGQQDQTTKVALCLVILFMQLHLVAVNFKGKLQSKERVMMLWSFLLFLIHIDGIHITTKINWLYECVSLCLLIMRYDIL